MKKIYFVLLISIVTAFAACNTTPMSDSVATIQTNPTESKAPEKIITSDNLLDFDSGPGSRDIYMAEGNGNIRFYMENDSSDRSIDGPIVRNIVAGKDKYDGYFNPYNTFAPYIIEEDIPGVSTVKSYVVAPYERSTYSVDEYGNETIIETKQVNRTAFDFKFKVTNFTSEDFTVSQFPYLVYICEDEQGNEHFDAYTYKDIEGGYNFPNTPIYIGHSDNPYSQNYDEYCKVTVPAHGDLEINLIHVLDNDRFTSAYLCFPAYEGDVYYELCFWE